MAPGTLHLVATPIGNVSDLSPRALETLRAVDLIASEDTRTTGVLLKRLGVAARQIPFHEHNEVAAARRILAALATGKSVALVSDAGTPAISDPGYTLVRDALAANVAVSAVPGPCALILALVLSGLPTSSFTFRGFPPRKSGPRRRFFALDAQSPHTLVFYESPHRLLQTLEDASVVLGDRSCSVSNDLTKLFERVYHGSIKSVMSDLAEAPLKGEYTVVVAGAGRHASDDASG